MMPEPALTLGSSIVCPKKFLYWETDVLVIATMDGMHSSTISVVESSVFAGAVSEMPAAGRSSLPSLIVGVGEGADSCTNCRVPADWEMLLFKIVTPENTRADTTPKRTASPATRPIIFAALFFFGFSGFSPDL